MLLAQKAHFNDLSPKLRKELEERVRGFGNTVRYKFDIARTNPDPSRYNGDIVFPNMYTLDPARFNIKDKYEDRADKQQSKLIALVEDVDEKGLPNRFKKIKVQGRDKGILKLNLEDDNSEDFAFAVFLELHPKQTGGLFFDKTKQQVFSRIDEQSAAKTQREERSIRKKAMDYAEQMSDKDMVDFADAMQWDSSMDKGILKNQIEALAETEPAFFNDLVKGKTVEYQALVKQALNKNIIAYDPAEYKFTYAGNKQPITVVSPVGDKTEVAKLAEWLMIGGGAETYKKLKSLVEAK